MATRRSIKSAAESGDPLDAAFELAYAAYQFPLAADHPEAVLDTARWHIQIGDIAVAPARRLFDAGVRAGRGE